MRQENGYKMFGFWEGTPYGEPTDRYEDFLRLRNNIDREKVIRHIETLEDWISGTMSRDIFTGEQFNAGFYEDGEFRFPVDFLRYYKTRGIGIPYEYEAYLKTILK